MERLVTALIYHVDKPGSPVSELLFKPIYPVSFVCTCGYLHDFCLLDCRRARKGATEARGGETAGQHRPEESQGGAGAKNLQSRCWKIHQPCHNVRNTHEYRLLQSPLCF